ncbi:DUF302 domain-containing protein [Glycomyces sp. YM15]|uniref:DUF302 domain-containing protein n=1 Tax=Glycomyces sp. YM15 TaxID=2800446 RepID=UPI001963C15F|nr:DUF302 domain-containing protein [Glycomyces sp. YM15]
MEYWTTIRLRKPFVDTVDLVREALQEQGFGVLTEIDVRATLREKIGEETEDYLILGACNPVLAFQALEVDRRIGLLLPCNVVVRADGNETVVEAVAPQILVDVTGEPDLAPVAAEAGRRLRAAIEGMRP